MAFGFDTTAPRKRKEPWWKAGELAVPLFVTGALGIAIAVALFSMGNAGTVNEATVGESIVYWFSLRHFATISLLFGSIIPIGWVIKDHANMRISSFGWGKIILGSFALFCLSPCVFFNRVIVEPTRLTIDDRWLWFWPRVERIDLRTVRSVQQTTEVDNKGRRPKTTNYFVFDHLDGHSTKVTSTLLLKTAQPRIEQLIAKNDAAPAQVAAAPPPAVEPVPPAGVVEPKPAVDAVATEPPSIPETVATVDTEPEVSETPNLESLVPTERIEPAGPVARNAPLQLRVGTAVEIEWGNQWWPGKVIAIVGAGQVKVHYDGWSTDEVVPTNRVRQREIAKREPRDVAKGQSGRSATIEVEWGGQWWPAEIKEVLPDGRMKVHYQGWSDASDEVVPPARVRSLASPDKPSSRPRVGKEPAADMRTWTDRTGKHLEAVLVEVIGGKARFRKADGKVVSVPLAKLSDEDRQYLREIGATKAE